MTTVTNINQITKSNWSRRISNKYTPFPDKEFPRSAAHDWNDTNTNRIIEIIPMTNFVV